MPIPTRLANDGWWLCERPSTALVCNFPSRQVAQKWLISPRRHPMPAPFRKAPFPVKPAIAVALAALADWLFYDQRIGISAVVFAIALACGSLLANFATLEQKQALLAGILVLAGLVPAVEEFNVVSLFFMVLALGVGLLLTTNRKFDSARPTGFRASRPLSVRSIQILPGRPRRVQSAGTDGGPRRVVHSRVSSAASSYFCSPRPIR